MLEMAIPNAKTFFKRKFAQKYLPTCKIRLVYINAACAGFCSSILYLPSPAFSLKNQT